MNCLSPTKPQTNQLLPPETQTDLTTTHPTTHPTATTNEFHTQLLTRSNAITQLKTTLTTALDYKSS